MRIDEMNIDQVEARMAEIRSAQDQEGADIPALLEEARALAARREELRSAAAGREELRGLVAAGAGQRAENQPAPAPENRTLTVDSKEYRTAWLKALRGRPLTAVEQRAYTVAGGATATITMNRIMEQVRHHAWLLERVTTIYANGKIEYYIEGTNNEAKDHTENQTIAPEADTLTKITLTPSEITKMIQISAASEALSIDAFEDWLVRTLGEAIARKIVGKMLTTMLAAASSAGTGITADTVAALMGGIKGDDIVLVCNNNTLYTKLLPLQDASKNRLVTFEGNKARVYGRVVELDDHMEDGVLLGGDMSKFVAEMAEDIEVRRQYDINTNSEKMLGVGLYDGKVGIASAFKKIEAGA